MPWDIDNPWVWFIAAGVIIVLVAAAVAPNLYRPKHRAYKSKSYEQIQSKQDGWAPTGRIDFSDAQSTGEFVLQVEDTRIVNGIGGVEHREIRWRKATLDEAKAVLIAYHAQRDLAMTASYVVSSSTIMRRQNSDVENQHQAAQVGKDETSGEKSKD